MTPFSITNQKSIVPVVRPESTTGLLVEEAGTQEVSMSGVLFTAGHLAMGQPISLLGISSHPDLLERGVQDFTDTLDPVVVLEKIYIKVPEDDGTFNMIKFYVRLLSNAQFDQSAECPSSCSRYLNFDNSEFVLDKATQGINGPLTGQLAALLATRRMKLRAVITGHVNLDTGTVELHAKGISAWEDSASDNQLLECKSLSELVEKSTIVAYDLLAFRA